jgi:hypothetical protein
MEGAMRDDAAYSEAVNEAGLEAERVYDVLVEDREFGIEFVRSLLRLRKATQLTCENVRRITTTPNGRYHHER